MGCDWASVRRLVTDAHQPETARLEQPRGCPALHVGQKLSGVGTLQSGAVTASPELVGPGARQA